MTNIRKRRFPRMNQFTSRGKRFIDPTNCTKIYLMAIYTNFLITDGNYNSSTKICSIFRIHKNCYIFSSAFVFGADIDCTSISIVFSFERMNVASRRSSTTSLSLYVSHPTKLLTMQNMENPMNV